MGGGVHSGLCLLIRVAQESFYTHWIKWVGVGGLHSGLCILIGRMGAGGGLQGGLWLLVGRMG